MALTWQCNTLNPYSAAHAQLRQNGYFAGQYLISPIDRRHLPAERQHAKMTMLR